MAKKAVRASTKPRSKTRPSKAQKKTATAKTPATAQNQKKNTVKAAKPAKVKETIAVQETPQVSAPIVEAPAAPSRPPTRKILGPDKTLTVVPQRAAAVQPANGATAAEPAITGTVMETAVSAPAIASAVTAAVAAGLVEKTAPLNPFRTNGAPKPPPAPTYAWNALPKSMPPQLAFLVTSASRESVNAATSPFPFAKYIAALPTSVCGYGFALVLLSVDHSNEEISKMTGLAQDRVDAMLEHAGSNLDDAFAAHCPEMHRKWRAQLAGRSATIDALIEQHLIDKVDRDFQRMLALVTLKAMGVPAPTSAPVHPELALAKHHS